MTYLKKDSLTIKRSNCKNSYSEFEDFLLKDFKESISSLPYDPNVNLRRPELSRQLNENKILTLQDQFFYITDLSEVVNVYVHPHIKDVLGYDQEYFIEFRNIYNCLHPDEREFVISFSRESILYPRTMPPEMQKLLYINPFLMVFFLSFRMKKKSGEYIWVNRLTSCYRTNPEGHMIYTLSFFTDISHIKKTSELTFGWKGDPYGKFKVDELCKKYLPCCFSQREKEIVILFSKGYSGVEIANKLNISKHTVISHRKNMLHKTKTKNTAELVHFAVSKGII